MARRQGRGRLADPRCQLRVGENGILRPVRYLLDDRENYGEERFVILGMAEGERLLVCSLYRTRGAHSHHFSLQGNET